MAAALVANRIAALQLSATPDVAANLDSAARLTREARERGAATVVLPEAFAFLGPERDKREILEPLPDPAAPRGDFQPGPILAACQALARETGVHLLLGGFHEAVPAAAGHEPGMSYNSCVHLAPDGAVMARYRKIHLFDVSLADGTELRESARTVPGDRVRVSTTPCGVIGLSVCYDLRFPYLYQALVDLGATVLIVPSAFTRPTGAAHWHVLLRARAIESQCYLVAPAQHGQNWEKRASYGHSLIIDPWGEIIAELADGDGVLIADVDPQRLASVRAQLPSLTHRRPLPSP